MSAKIRNSFAAERRTSAIWLNLANKDVRSILWIALFGLFGHMYIPSHPTPKQSGQIRMKHAVWVDLVNALLWLFTAVYATIIFVRSRGSRTMHTGRASV